MSESLHDSIDRQLIELQEARNSQARAARESVKLTSIVEADQVLEKIEKEIARRKRAAKKEEKKLDALIEAAYYRHFNNVPVKIMDLSKIHSAAKAAVMGGKDLDEAMAALVPIYSSK